MMNAEQIVNALRIINCDGRNCSSCPCDEYRKYAKYEACDDGTRLIAAELIESMQAKLDAIQNPQPLTLEQLKERSKRHLPIWTVTVSVVGSGRWEIMTLDDNEFPDVYYNFKTWCEDYREPAHLIEKTYGKTWLAYDHEPKGE